MSAQAHDPPPEAKKLPTGRVARTARVGGLVTGQGVRWAGMRAANRVRTPERAAAAENERTAALVHELVEQLGQMRGAAMKIGQMISMVELDGLAEEQQDELQRELATLRDGIPPVPFARLEKLLRKELGAPLASVFSDFDEHAFAAASIGQVHRATTLDGEQVVAKVQYPGVAEAVETDLRNAMMLLPLVKRLAPGLDAKALATEMRERIGEELDYELEAQNQRRIERLMRGHPFIRVPRVYTDLSTRRVLVSEYIEGESFEAVRRADEAQRDRYGEIVFRFFFGLLYRDRIALGDPHPGNYLLRPDGRVCFLDFGLLRDVDAGRVAAGASDRARGPRKGRDRSESRSGRRRLSARRSGGLGRRRPRLEADATGDQVVRRAGRSVDSRPATNVEAAIASARQRAAGRDQDAGQPVHRAAGISPDPANARHRRDRAAATARRRRLGRDRGRVSARRRARDAAGAGRSRFPRAPRSVAEDRSRDGRAAARVRSQPV